MNLKAHQKSCRELLGDPFTEIHQFLDQYSDPSYPVHLHRRILHHQRGVELIVEKFGEIARCPTVLHIMDDGLVREDGDIIRDWDDWEWVFFRGRKDIDEQLEVLRALYGIP